VCGLWEWGDARCIYVSGVCGVKVEPRRPDKT